MSLSSLTHNSPYMQEVLANYQPSHIAISDELRESGYSAATNAAISFSMTLGYGIGAGATLATAGGAALVAGVMGAAGSLIYDQISQIEAPAQPATEITGENFDDSGYEYSPGNTGSGPDYTPDFDNDDYSGGYDTISSGGSFFNRGSSDSGNPSHSLSFI